MECSTKNYIKNISTTNISDLCEDDFNNIPLEKKIGDNVNSKSEDEKAVKRHAEILMKLNKNSGMMEMFGLIMRLMLPLANTVAGKIKNIHLHRVCFVQFLKNFLTSRQTFINKIAFIVNTISMNLSTIQEPILKVLKIYKANDRVEGLQDGSIAMSNIIFTSSYPEFQSSLPDLSFSERSNSISTQLSNNCCTIQILSEPPVGQPIRADIVFIHGLHGSLKNTWKQGLWVNERRPIEFERQPKPQVRPPKRLRHCRSNISKPTQKRKRARFANKNLSESNESYDEFDDLSERNFENSRFLYNCDKPKVIQTCVDWKEDNLPLSKYDNICLHQNEYNDDKHSKNKSGKPCSTNEANSLFKNISSFSDKLHYSQCWPADWLPLDCPGVRVIAVNYTTDPYLWRPLWKKKESRTNLMQRSREMAELLISHKVGHDHPIIWVGHSKGGLFIKQIIVDAWESERVGMKPLWRSSRGVFFYSVPHRGSQLASIKAPFLTRSIELIDIEKNNKYLLDLHRRFAGLYYLGHLKIEVFSFVEMALTLMSVLYLRIVGVDSADPGIGDVCGIHLDHREICKPRNRDCILYKQLVKMINNVS